MLLADRTSCTAASLLGPEERVLQHARKAVAPPACPPAPPLPPRQLPPSPASCNLARGGARAAAVQRLRPSTASAPRSTSCARCLVQEALYVTAPAHDLQRRLRGPGATHLGGRSSEELRAEGLRGCEPHGPILQLSDETYFLNPEGQHALQELQDRVETLLRQRIRNLRSVSLQLPCEEDVLQSAFEDKPLCVPRQLAELR